MEKNRQNEKKLEINLNEKIAGGQYSNLAVVTHSPSDFIVDFCQVLPGMKKAQVCSRIILSPQHAKALLNTLNVNVKKYEQTFGEIKEVRNPKNPLLKLDEKKKYPN
ncbi:MAG: DUF3467 domain-containing protein [Candidatus Marinimicrobia bacterium]|nr:DUF3467 domain-containing protein [Candidatus Neomarinimicrobiota bacterium]